MRFAATRRRAFVAAAVLLLAVAVAVAIGLMRGVDEDPAAPAVRPDAPDASDEARALAAPHANDIPQDAPPVPLRYTVCVQPLGEHDATLLPPVERGIAQAYGFAVRRLDARALPDFAWYPPQARHRADALLAYLLYDVLPSADGCHAVIGFTAVDVSTTKGEHVDWGVLGLAYQGGRVAVVSSHRLRRGVEHTQLVERAVKVVLHELGHVIGVPHRDDGPGCLMNDAVGAVATIDRAEGAMCTGERLAAERFLGYRLPVPERLDWPTILGQREMMESEKMRNEEGGSR